VSENYDLLLMADADFAVQRY